MWIMELRIPSGEGMQLMLVAQGMSRETSGADVGQMGDCEDVDLEPYGILTCGTCGLCYSKS